MLTKIEDYSPWQIAWTVFLAVLSPLPYKVIAIAAGALKINIPIFLITSLAGRGKRFIVEGVLIYFCGPSAIQLFRDYTQASTIVLVAVVLVGGGIWWWRRTHKPLPTDPCLEITDTAEEG
jgi:undecaprenyl-diphosphatase